MENLNISPTSVTKLLKGLNMNKASGPYKISPKMLNEFAEDLTAIFTTSLVSGRIPHQWTSTLLASIFEKRNRNNAANNRRVSYDIHLL